MFFRCNECGYRIEAIMRPCQGRETGASPVTRSYFIETKSPSYVVRRRVFGEIFQFCPYQAVFSIFLSA